VFLYPIPPKKVELMKSSKRCDGCGEAKRLGGDHLFCRQHWPQGIAFSEARALLANATPGPWPSDYVYEAIRHVARNCDFITSGTDPDFGWDRYSDSPLIAAAPRLLAALVDEVERLREENADIESIYIEVRAERERAHAKHGATSMEAFPVDDMNRLAILMEEVGEVAREFNEARHDDRPVDLPKLREELVQSATMAIAWADVIRQPTCDDCDDYGEVRHPNWGASNCPSDTVPCPDCGGVG
jgi:NTP pyrophosphatase (non-canonical NTP hydrolase)